MLLFEDECSFSNTAGVGYNWSPKGAQPAVVCKQRKQERLTLMGSLNYETGQATVDFHEKGNQASFRKHIRRVLRAYRDSPKIIMVLDNVRYHHAKALKSWLSRHPKIDLVYLPPYSPNLNPVERMWWYMRKRITHNRFLKTLDERKAEFWKMFSRFLEPNDELTRVCEIDY